MITVTTEGANRLRLAFPYNPTFVAFIKGCPGSQFDKETKTWTAPLSVWDTLIAKFPDYVEADYDVWVLVDDRPRRFAQSLLYMGVRLYLDGDQVIADGPGVSPLLQEEVTKRAAAIAQLLRTNALVNPDSTPVRPQAAPAGVLSANEERIFNAIRVGSQNAFIADEKKQEQRSRQRAKAKQEQGQKFQWNRSVTR